MSFPAERRYASQNVPGRCILSPPDPQRENSGRDMHIHLTGVIAIAGGVYALLAALRIVRVSKNPEANEVWLRKYGLLLKILGPVLILFGFAEFFALVN